jgi:hypothetical protein
VGEPATDVYVPEDGKVAIRDQDGSVWKIPQEQLVEATHEGARPATEAEYFGAQHGKAGEVLAGGAGFARTATFGLSDPAYVEAARAFGGAQNADEMRDTLRLLKESSPNANLAGEVAGVVPTMFLGGAGAAEGGAALAEGAAMRFGQRALAAAPRAVGEGVAIGLGSQLSEDTLSNHKWSSEAYLSAGVKGGALGLLLGAGGAGVLGAAGDKAGAWFGRGERGALQAEESIGARVGREAEGGPYRAAAAREAEAAGETGGRKSILERMEDLQNEQAYKATGANQTDWKRLGAEAEGRAGTARRLGKMLQEETFEGRRLVEATTSQEETARRIAGRQEEVGKTIAPMYAEADRAAARPSVSAIREGMGEIRAKYAGMYEDLELRGAEDSFSRLEKTLGETPTHTELWKARREIDGQLRKAYAADKTTGMVPQGEEALRDLRGVVNDALMASAERAGQELGGTLGDRMRLANRLYADLSTAHSASTRASARMSGNQGVSITDVIAGAGGGLAGIAAAGANMVRRKYGNQIAAHVLGTASKMETIQRAATKLDSLLSEGSLAFVSGGKGMTRAVRPVTTAEVRELREATRSPEAISARIAEHLGDMPKYAPKTAQEIAITAARAAAWAQHALPKESPPISPMFGKRKETPLSDTQLLKARATIETIEDGSIVIDRMRQGRLTPEHVAALKYVHPETYAAIQKYLGQHTAELNKNLSQQQLFSLSMLFGTPLTEAALPENVRAFQASFTQGNQAPAAGTPGAPSMSAGPVQGGGSRATSTDKLEAGQ